MDEKCSPKFSVIIPVFNADRYLDECINSVLCQTIHDYEVLLIDDGSTDRSGVICYKYADIYPNKVFVIHQLNQGQVLARRNGIVNAKGEILLFLDADDRFEVNAFETIAQAFKQYSCDIVMFTSVLFNDTGYQKTTVFPFYNGQVFEGKEKRTLYTYIASGSLLNNLSYKAARRGLFDLHIDYSNYVSITIADDLFQVIPLITNANRVVYINEPLYCYRRGHGSISSKYRIKNYNALKTVSNRIKEYMKIWGMEKELTTAYQARCLGSVAYAVRGVFSINKKFRERGTVVRHYCTIRDDVFFINAYTNNSMRELPYAQRIQIWLLLKRYVNVLYWYVRCAYFTNCISHRVRSSVNCMILRKQREQA